MILDYHQFGGRQAGSACLKGLLAHAGIANPVAGRPFSEALCFGLAGGIGAGYSFCPSVVRHGAGSGVSIPGRYKAYATGPDWFQGCFDRLGIATRITETAAPGKALQNLRAELAAGRPAIVWCSQARLPFLGPAAPLDLWMHSFVVYGMDEQAGLAFGADRAATPVTLTLDELAAARAGVCAHKNRTLTFDLACRVDRSQLRRAVEAVLPLTVAELVDGKIKTFSLAGLETWAKMIVNAGNKDGWLKVFQGPLLYMALRDVFESIETEDAAGGLGRGLYADFLDEAAELSGMARMATAAKAYRALAGQWTALAEAALPDGVKAFKQTKELVRKRTAAFVDKGAKGMKVVYECAAKLTAIRDNMTEFPFGTAATQELLSDLRERIVGLHASELAAAQLLAP